ncbi:MAG: hypothetical protein H8D94_00915, partial [Candidatus Pelagibacter sp.]|nr:hypothetical protein [Candidatus Pelagibacter sp.]
DGVFEGVNSLDASSDLYSTVSENVTNTDNIDNMPGYIYGKGSLEIMNLEIWRSSGDDHFNDDMRVYFLDDAINSDLKNYISLTNSYLQSNDITYNYLWGTALTGRRIYRANNDDNTDCVVGDEGVYETEVGPGNIIYDDFSSLFEYQCGNSSNSSTPQNGCWNLDLFPFVNNGYDLNSNSWEDVVNTNAFTTYDVDGAYYIVVWMEGDECEGITYDDKSRKSSMKVYRLAKSHIYNSWWEQKSICIRWGNSETCNADVVVDLNEPSHLESTGSTDYDAYAWKAENLVIKINPPSTFDTTMDSDYPYEHPYKDITSSLFELKPTTEVATLGIVKSSDSSYLDSSSDVLDFRPISTVTTTTEIADDNGVEDFYDVQSYYENLMDTEKDKVSAPNTVKLSLKIASAADNFEIDYLTLNDAGDFGFIGFVTNWDLNESEDPTTLDELAGYFPNSNVGMNLKQSTDDTYYYIQSVTNDDGNFVIESDYLQHLQHTYQTAGIKIIQAVVFSYLENPNNDGTIQAIRWKLVKIKIYLDMDSVYIQDFSDIGGFDFTHIPWPYTTGIIGGLSEKSKYRKSLTQLVRTSNFQESEYLDKSLTKLAYNNDELGNYFGNSDVSQLRLFSSGSYDLNTLLGISELAYIDNSDDGTPDDYKPPSNSDYWDGIINQFPHESSVGSIFINDEKDIDFKESCVLELNCGDVDGDVIRDSSGNGNKGILIGDFELKKDSKEIPLGRDSAIKVPNTSTDDLAF